MDIQEVMKRILSGEITSLLTDEERELYEQHVNPKVEMPQMSWSDKDVIFRALIAARAENKRKDEHIANLEREAQYALDFLENWELSDFPSAAHDESTQGSLYMTIAGLQEVLLQSEKGGVE